MNNIKQRTEGETPTQRLSRLSWFPPALPVGRCVPRPSDRGEPTEPQINKTATEFWKILYRKWVLNVKEEKGTSPNPASGICLRTQALTQSHSRCWMNWRREKVAYMHKYWKKVFAELGVVSLRKNQTLGNIAWTYGRCFILKMIQSLETREILLLPSHRWNSVRRWAKPCLWQWVSEALFSDPSSMEQVHHWKRDVIGDFILNQHFNIKEVKSEPKPIICQKATISYNAL